MYYNQLFPYNLIPDIKTPLPILDSEKDTILKPKNFLTFFFFHKPAHTYTHKSGKYVHTNIHPLWLNFRGVIDFSEESITKQG